MSSTTYEIAKRNLATIVRMFSPCPLTEQKLADLAGTAEIDCLIMEIGRAERYFSLNVVGESVFDYETRTRDV